MNKQDLKNEYRNKYEKIQELINAFDPCGLIRLGAPIDEYESLTNKLISLTNQSTTVERIKETITEEMRNHFGVEAPPREPLKSKFNRDLETFANNIRSLANRYQANA